jgi:hypothetical protein
MGAKTGRLAVTAAHVFSRNFKPTPSDKCKPGAVSKLQLHIQVKQEMLSYETLVDFRCPRTC